MQKNTPADAAILKAGRVRRPRDWNLGLLIDAIMIQLPDAPPRQTLQRF